jgi:nicotinamide riboside transporter PnuC
MKNTVENAANTQMILAAVLGSICIIAFIIGIVIIYTLNKIKNKNNYCAICLTALFTVLLVLSSVYWWGYVRKKQSKVEKKQQTLDCDDYTEWLLFQSPTVEWGLISAGLISAEVLVILSIAGLFIYKPKENKILFPACIITSIVWLFTFLISHKFNQCQLKRYVNKYCIDTSTPV